MAKWMPYPYRVPRGYGYCRGTAACVPQAYPFLPPKKIPGMGWVGSGTGWVRAGPKLSQTASFPLDLFSSLSSLRQSHSILSLTSLLYRRRAMEGAPIVDLRQRKVLRLWTCSDENCSDYNLTIYFFDFSSEYENTGQTKPQSKYLFYCSAMLLILGGVGRDKLLLFFFFF